MEERKNRRHTKEILAVEYQNAFLLLMKHNSERVMEENACLCPREISNKCGEEWAALDATNKKRYKDINAEDTKRHSKDMEGFNNNTDGNENVEGNKTIWQF